jgi:hypothetical protein
MRFKNSYFIKFHLRLQLILIFAAFSFSISAQEIKFKNTKYNFGFVREGEIVKMQFEFKNTGTLPLVISDYKVECGCTVMEKPDKPIMPGSTSVLKITFDTHEKYDRQDRTIEVISNAINSPVVLRFKGVVLKPKKS